jgi:alkanesulfonate monooxygenase SsuD/methylene tetrahydromethanopterin reductase-like flavin-dependent oxidoreductase (luciferase family)
MQFGLFMMPLHPPHRAIADAYDRDLALLVAADRLGYHEAWIGEHVTERWENAPVPELLIAKALAMTEKIILSTGVSLLALHNPVQLAHRIAMLDHLARGRLYWGIGSGAIATDLRLFGLGSMQRQEVRARAAETLDVVLKLWAADGKFTYHGTYFNIDAPDLDAVTGRGLYMKPYQQPHPPIGVASTTVDSGSLRLAGARGWIPMSSSLLAPPYLKRHWQMVQEGAAGAGRVADRRQWRIARDIFVADTPTLARQRALAVLGRNYVQHQYHSRTGTPLMAATKIDPTMPDEAIDVEYLLEHLWIVGDPSECAARLRALYEVSGGFGTLLAITQDSDDPTWDHRSLQLLIEEVGPRLADLP